MRVLKMKMRIQIDQDSWDAGLGPLSQEQMDEYGLTEYGHQPVDDTVLGRYIGPDGRYYEVLSTPDGTYLVDVQTPRVDRATPFELVEEYVASGKDYIDPVMIRWLDTGKIEIIPGPHLTDISWSERGRPYERIARLENLDDYIDLTELEENPPRKPIIQKTTITEYECPDCHHRWLPRKEEPMRCPKCQLRFVY